jgi:uncharacterized protein YkwD
LPRRLLLPLSAAIALALPVPAALAACTSTDVAASDPSAVAATLCLLNQQRAQHGLAGFSENAVLDTASADYARDMVKRQFFDHVSPGGGTFLDRMKSAGWAPQGGWSAAENIAWGSGELGTPASIVDSWMHSSGHRANILNGSFGQIGIGVASGAPRDGIAGDAGTYVTNFASAAAKTAAVKTKRAPVARCASRARAARTVRVMRSFRVLRRCSAKR